MSKNLTAEIVQLPRLRDLGNSTRSEAASHLPTSVITLQSNASRMAADHGSERPASPGQMEGGEHGLQDYEARRRQCALDCELVLSGELTRTALRQKYKAEERSHKNMLERRGKDGRTVAPEWRDFVRFLADVGPRPTVNYTLDRLKNTDPEYAPGKVQWRSKRDQSNNRRNTLYLSIGGETQPLTIWAARSGSPPDTIRHRLYLGWSDREAVYGRSKEASTTGSKLFWFGSRSDWWEQRFRSSGTKERRIAWYRVELRTQVQAIERRLDLLLGEKEAQTNGDWHEIPAEHAAEVDRLFKQRDVLWHWISCANALNLTDGSPASRFWLGYARQRTFPSFGFHRSAEEGEDSEE